MTFDLRIVVNVLVAVLSIGLWGSGWASPVAFTSRNAFDSAVLQIPHRYIQNYSFEKDANGNDLAGTLLTSAVPYGGGSDKVGMSIFSLDATVKISNAYPTTSGSNFLGTTDGDIFQGGDNFLLTFAKSNAYAIGMYFISADKLFDGDIELQVVAMDVGLFTVSLDASAVERTLSDGSQVYFLGLVDDTRSFNSAFISTDLNGTGNFLYNVDDIVVVVPEPSSVLLILTGVLLIAGFGNSRRYSVG